MTNERQIATELWEFLQQFYQLYPKYASLDLYIFGESYGKACATYSSYVPYYTTNLSIVAGHYVPATGQVIVESNATHAKNLKGLGIGNGWVDPYIQYAAYGEVSVCS